jgi:hypothetical protein
MLMTYTGLAFTLSRIIVPPRASTAVLLPRLVASFPYQPV